MRWFPTLAAAYEAKEDFYGLWDLADRQAAKEAYGAWTRQLPRDLEPAFRELTTAMATWETAIFAYFDHPITNAYTESLNNLIRLTNRLGRGYSLLRSGPSSCTPRLRANVPRRGSCGSRRRPLLS